MKRCVLSIHYIHMYPIRVICGIFFMVCEVYSQSQRYCKMYAAWNELWLVFWLIYLFLSVVMALNTIHSLESKVFFFVSLCDVLYGLSMQPFDCGVMGIAFEYYDVLFYTTFWLLSQGCFFLYARMSCDYCITSTVLHNLLACVRKLLYVLQWSFISFCQLQTVVYYFLLPGSTIKVMCSTLVWKLTHSMYSYQDCDMSFTCTANAVHILGNQCSLSPVLEYCWCIILKTYRVSWLY